MGSLSASLAQRLYTGEHKGVSEILSKRFLIFFSFVVMRHENQIPLLSR